MRVGSIRRFTRGAAVVSVAIGVTYMATPGPEPVQAQVRNGDFWLIQSHQTAPVGRAWASADRTREYWAYIDGEYKWAEVCNGPGNPWQLQAQRVCSEGYESFDEFRDAVKSLPAFEGKFIVFQDHSVTETTLQN